MSTDPSRGGPAHDPAGGAPVDVPALLRVLEDFAATVADPFSERDVLTRLVRGVVEVLPVEGAGVMVPDDGLLLRFVHAEGSHQRRIARAGQVQERLQEGPCVVSHRTGEVVSVADLADPADAREQGAWPRYRREVAETGVHAVTAVPLRAHGRGWGVLDVYRTSRGGFEPSQLAAARALADVATSYLVVAAERREAAAAREALAHRALHDPLTGLPVREVLLDHLSRSLARLTRHPGHVGVLFVDLDRFKEVNDTYGHAAGNDLLTTCAARMRQALRPEDLLARLGGDEFVVVLEELTAADDAHDVARRVLGALALPHRIEHATVTPSASIGVAVTSDPAATADALLAQADTAMYRAKRAGRGRVAVVDGTGRETSSTCPCTRADDRRTGPVGGAGGTADELPPDATAVERTLVDRATGALVAHLRSGPEDALAALAGMARESGDPLAAVAARVLDDARDGWP